MPNFASFQSDPDNLRTLINAQDSTGTNHPVASDTSGNLTTFVLGGTITAGTLTSVGTINEVVNVGTLSSVLGATITAGTLTSVGTVNNLTNVGTVSAILGATITAGTLSDVVNVGTLSSVLGATITAGTLTSVGTINNLTNVGTVSAILGATITTGTLSDVVNVGTLSSVLGATITAGTLTSVGTLTAISQKNFLEPQSLTGIVTSTSYTPLAAVTTGDLGTYSFFVYNFGPGGSVDARVEISADGTNYYVDTSDTNIAVGSVDVLVPSKFLKYTRLSYRSAVTPSTITVIADAQGA
ncbi:DUF6385 domain-containing protein [Alicyclobacillus tolerans]|uniref:DUF6385 domain-containing protein n=1 Tax=Alicyclobacillus tolerans TaxID=90970 RepID=UPI001F2587C0|nr:DUF6385 domain-containing protein [Alicyclobacillus tolerans]MCF8567612.1 DUF6385 domain-containing protein [Alicyclobacillus tolerans]